MVSSHRSTNDSRNNFHFSICLPRSLVFLILAHILVREWHYVVSEIHCKDQQQNQRHSFVRGFACNVHVVIANRKGKELLHQTDKCVIRQQEI